MYNDFNWTTKSNFKRGSDWPELEFIISSRQALACVILLVYIFVRELVEYEN